MKDAQRPMLRLLSQLTAGLNRLVKPLRDRLWERLRAHVALALYDDFRALTSHMTAERAELAARLTAETGQLRRQLDDLSLCNEGLLREVVRLEREVQHLSELVDRSAAADAADSHSDLVGSGPAYRRAA